MKVKKIYYILLVLLLVLSTLFPVYADDEDIEDSITETDIIDVSSDMENIPTLNSRAAIVYDRTSGTVIYGKSENEKRKMASTTKIMTALIVIENSKLTDTVEVSKKAAGIGGSRLGLKTGDKITVNDLLYGLMLCSGNDAAVALAEYVGGNLEEFANLMNQKSETLGLLNTHFVTPHGLDNDDHYTTAYELAKLTDYALKNETFSKIVATKNYTATINGYPRNLNNTNELLGNLNGVYGVKTGFTNGANRCLVTSVKRSDLDIICIVLGADTKKFRTQDSVKLIEYTFKNYEMVDIYTMINSEFESWKKDNLSNFNIIKAASNNLELSLDKIENNKIPIKNEDVKDISIDINCSYTLNSPIFANTSIGNLTLSIKDDVILNLDILCSNDIKKKSVVDYFSQLIINFIPSIEAVL